MAISIPICKNKCELKNLELNYDQKKKKYYLSAKFRIEDDYAVKELEVPRIRLDICKGLIIGEDYEKSCMGPSPMYIDMGFGKLPLEKEAYEGYALSAYYSMRIVEEKTREMTLSEIEKKLGYKVKIVAEKEG